MIILCYDGSPDSKAAARRVSDFFEGQPVTVLTVWEPYVEIMAQTGFGLAFPPPTSAVDEINEALEEQARTTADEAAEQLRHQGVIVTTRVEARRSSVWATIMRTADELGAKLVVLGSRGRGDVKSLLLGSISHAIVQHADRPVMIVPSDTVAERRAKERS